MWSLWSSKFLQTDKKSVTYSKGGLGRLKLSLKHQFYQNEGNCFHEILSCCYKFKNQPLSVFVDAVVGKKNSRNKLKDILKAFNENDFRFQIKHSGPETIKNYEIFFFCTFTFFAIPKISIFYSKQPSLRHCNNY